MLKSLAIATIAGLAFASCPNQCSGHGRCGANDQCICFTQVGGNNPYRESYTGVDCSLRTCPTGRAYDTISSAASGVSPVAFSAGPYTSWLSKTLKPVNKLQAFYNPSARTADFKGLRRTQKVVVKVMSITNYSPLAGTFTWKLEEDEYFTNETPIESSLSQDTARPLVKTVTTYTKNGAGVVSSSSVDYNTGIYVYFDQYSQGSYGWVDASGNALIGVGDQYSFSLNWNEAIEFDESDSNTAHQLVECSGRGVCDNSSGKCKCADGYTGEACQRTACPNMCSGHGQCQSEARFVSDSGITGSNYIAYDANQQYGCKCDAGYRGADCSQIECPSGEDVLGADGGAEGADCSGRGSCDYSTGVCKCHKGYYGERCESQTNFF